jgi:hypothetical protein
MQRVIAGPDALRPPKKPRASLLRSSRSLRPTSITITIATPVVNNNAVLILIRRICYQQLPRIRRPSQPMELLTLCRTIVWPPSKIGARGPIGSRQTPVMRHCVWVGDASPTQTLLGERSPRMIGRTDTGDRHFTFEFQSVPAPQLQSQVSRVACDLASNAESQTFVRTLRRAKLLAV